MAERLGSGGLAGASSWPVLHWLSDGSTTAFPSQVLAAEPPLQATLTPALPVLPFQIESVAEGQAQPNTPSAQDVGQYVIAVRGHERGSEMGWLLFPDSGAVRYFKDIPHAAHCVDEIQLRLRADLAAQPPDHCLDHVLLVAERHVPHM